MTCRSLCLVIFCLVSILSNAQNENPGPGTATVFSDDGSLFTLYINGDRKNGSPSTRVVADVVEVPVSFRIVFEKGNIPEIKKNGIRQGKHCLYAIHKNKNGDYVLRAGGCSEEVENSSDGSVDSGTSGSVSPVSTPAQLSAVYADGVININDGRSLVVKKVKVNGMTYPRLIFTALPGAIIKLSYDNGDESYSAESPMQYEVKDFSNNNAYFTMTVDEGGPERTWHVKLKNSNGYDLKVE